ncbi:MAG: hypothetical protein M1840_000998 [Geoglossum simile]|nr:MAG: hypothetical protein M1840_000998 [Geoglossum simile]
MPLNITIDHVSATNGSEDDSLSDGENSSGVNISPSSGVGSQEYADSYDAESWESLQYDELGPSDSASRPQTANHHRPIVEARPPPAHRQSSRRHAHQDRQQRHPPVHHNPVHHPPGHRQHRHSQPITPEIVDPAEEYSGGYARGQPSQHVRPPTGHWAPSGPPPGYPPSFASGQSYQNPFISNSVVPANTNQLIPFGGQSGYNYSPNPFSPGPSTGGQGYYSHGHHGHHSHHGGTHMNNPLSTRPPSGYGTQEIMPYQGQGAGYYFNPQGYYQANGLHGMYYPFGMGQSQPPQPPQPQSTPPQQSPHSGPTPPPPVESSKDDEKFARLEQLILDQKKEAEEKEARARKVAEEKEAAEKKAAEELAARKAAEEAVAKAAADAAAAATAVAKEAAEAVAKEAAEVAEKRLAEESAARKAAEEAAAKASAAAEAAAAEVAAATKPKAEKKKPLRFKDAVGRKFSFPFHLCQTWAVRIPIPHLNKINTGTDKSCDREWRSSLSKPFCMLRL